MHSLTSVTNHVSSITFSKEYNPLGTAGALASISKKNINFPIIVTNGDVLCECKFNKIID